LSSAFLDFSTDAVEAAERFEFWRQNFGAVHAVELEPHQRATFEARCRNWRLGPVVIGEFTTPGRQIVRTLRQTRRDDLDHIILRVLPDGPTVWRENDQKLIAQPDEVYIGTFANSYDLTFPAGRWVTAMLDRAAFPQFWGWSGASQQLRGASAALLAAFLTSLPRALVAMEAHEEARVAEAVRATISTFLAGCPSLNLVDAERGQVSLRLLVQQIIGNHLASPRLTPARIAELAGVSRSALYRAFEAEGGIAQYILRRRLLLVRQDLAAPSLAGLSIAEIAERRGLHNAASFHRAFRQQFGETPGACRANARSGLGASASEGWSMQVQAARQFIDLLRP
jgi:AraC-like DNA-binding protein